MKYRWIVDVYLQQFKRMCSTIILPCETRLTIFGSNWISHLVTTWFSYYRTRIICKDIWPKSYSNCMSTLLIIQIIWGSGFNRFFFNLISESLLSFHNFLFVPFRCGSWQQTKWSWYQPSAMMDLSMGECLAGFCSYLFLITVCMLLLWCSINWSIFGPDFNVPWASLCRTLNFFFVFYSCCILFCETFLCRCVRFNTSNSSC